MYGPYEIPFDLELKGSKISFQKKEGFTLYKRMDKDNTVEITVKTTRGKVLVNPVEPFNKPKKLASHLLIEFASPFVIESRSNARIFLRLPVEIGVFIETKKEYRVLDILNLTMPKYTLYGSPKDGLICRYCRSDIYTSIPEVDPLFEGILELNIMNETNKWIELTKTCLSANGMKTFYNEKTVSQKASMVITGVNLAETAFIDLPLEKGMKKAVELFSYSIPIGERKFIMEEGF